MSIMVSDQKIENDGIQQSLEVNHRGAGQFAQQRKALFERRPAFVLVFIVRTDAKCLAKILLMFPFQIFETVWSIPQRDPVVTLNEEIINFLYLAHFSFGRVQANRMGQ